MAWAKRRSALRVFGSETFANPTNGARTERHREANANQVVGVWVVGATVVNVRMAVAAAPLEITSDRRILRRQHGRGYCVPSRRSPVPVASPCSGGGHRLWLGRGSTSQGWGVAKSAFATAWYPSCSNKVNNRLRRNQTGSNVHVMSSRRLGVTTKVL